MTAHEERGLADQEGTRLTLRPRIFVDREAHKSTFEAILRDHCTGAPRSRGSSGIHVWYGAGGLGKSELRYEFEEVVKSRQLAGDRISLGVLDFDNPRHRDPPEALLKIRLDLGREHKFLAPTFDLAFRQLFELDYPGDDMRQKHPGLFRPYSQHTEEILEYLDDVCRHIAHLTPLPPPAKLLFKYGVHLTGKLQDWWNSRETRPFMTQIESMSGTQIRELLPLCLAFDLRRAMTDTERRGVVLLMDTFDALVHATPVQGAIGSDQWVNTLARETPDALIVIFGREQLRWKIDVDECLAGIRHYELEELADCDAHDFLRRAGVDTPDVCERIVASARGLPFTLGLARDQYERLKARKRAPSAKDFAKTPDEVLSRLMKHMPAPDRDRLRIASYLQEMNRPLFLNLCKECYGSRATADWPRLIQYSIIKHAGEDRVKMHAVAREQLQAHEREENPEFFRETHEWLFTYFEKDADAAPSAREIRPNHERALEAAARHLREASPDRLIRWIVDQRWQKFYDAMRWKSLSAVFATGQPVAERLPPDAVEGIWFNHHRAHVFQSIGLYTDAKRCFELALERFPLALQQQRQREPAQVATLLHAFADVCWSMGGSEQALARKLCYEALELYESGNGQWKARHADALLSAARVHEADGHESKAEEFYAEAQRKVREADVQPLVIATFLLKLARARRARARLAEAAHLYDETIKQYLASGAPESEGYAAALLDWAQVCAACGEREVADKAFGDAVVIYQSELGEVHPNFARARFLHDCFHLEVRGRDRERADRIAQANDLLEATLGSAHPWTIEAAECLRTLSV